MSQNSPVSVRAVNPPAIDNVVLPAIGNVAAREVSFQISSELMKNQQKASPVSPSKAIRVAQDNVGSPMIFTIGTDNGFQLLKSDVAATGWTSVDLSAGFTEYGEVKAFDVTQDSKGRISVALALSKKDGASSDIYVASLVSDDAAKTDWTKFASLCKRISGVDPGFVAEQIRLGTSESDHSPLVVISGNIGGQKYYYQSLDLSQEAVKLEFPENVSPDSNAMMDISLGHVGGQRGIFFLYNIGNTETLECTTLRDAEEGPQHYDYSPGNPDVPAELRNLRYNCMATPTVNENDPDRVSSDIYVGTDKGIYVFRAADVGKVQKVTDQIADVHEIIVRQDDDSISVWAVSSPSKLYYVYGKKGATYTWNEAILFNNSIIHIAPIRSVSKQSNELFLVNQDLSVAHYWQDPSSTLWQQRTIKVGSKGYLLDFESFTTQIHVEDQDGNPLTNQTLRITASEWTYVTANGLVYSLDQDNAAEIETDGMGNITIIGMATDIATPILHVEGDFFGKTLNIYANGKIQKGLEAIRNGDDLKNAKTKDGKPVLNKDYDQATLNGIATNVQHVTGASTQYVIGTRSGTNVFVTVEDKGVKHTGVLSVAHLPDDFAVGMRLKDGGWQLHTDAVKAALGPGDIIEDIIDFAGDALHWLETEFDDAIQKIADGVVYLADGVSFVFHKVKDGLNDVLVFALQFGKKLLNIALKTLASVFKVLNWILKQIGITLKEILAWLGHLFGWDDIWDTHKVIAAMLTNGLDYAVACVNTQVEHWRASVKTTFADVREKINSLVPTEGLKTWAPGSVSNGVTRNNPGVSYNSPQTNFTGYQLAHGGMLDSVGLTKAPLPAILSVTGDPLVQFVNDVVKPTLSALLTDVERDLDDLKRLCTDPAQTLESVLRFVKDLALTVLDPLATIADGFLKFFEDLLTDIKDALESEIDIPFLSDFYEFITGLLGDEEEFTFINGLSLLLAIPVVEISRIVTGDAPFSDGKHGLDDPDLFVKLIGPPSNPGSAFPQTNSLVTADSKSTGLAASDDGLWLTLAHYYSRIGAMIASVAVGIQKIIELFGWASVPDDQVESKKLSTADKVLVFFTAVKNIFTFPVPRPGIDTKGAVAYVFKFVAYLTCFGEDVITLPAKVPMGKLASGLSTCVADTVVLGCCLVADIIELTDGASESRIWTLANDCASNLFGCSLGAGLALQSKAVDQPEIGKILEVIGVGGGLVAAVSVFLEAIRLDEHEVLHVVNVGG